MKIDIKRKTGPQLSKIKYCGSVLFHLIKGIKLVITITKMLSVIQSICAIVITMLTSYDIRFNCCNATRPILNKAQEAAANSGNKTTRSLVSAIKVNFCLQYIKYLFDIIIHLL